MSVKPWCFSTRPVRLGIDNLKHFSRLVIQIRLEADDEVLLSQHIMRLTDCTVFARYFALFFWAVLKLSWTGYDVQPLVAVDFVRRVRRDDKRYGVAFGSGGWDVFRLFT